MQKEGQDVKVSYRGDEVSLEFPIDLDTEHGDIEVEFRASKLSVGVRGESLLEGTFPEGCCAYVPGRLPQRDKQSCVGHMTRLTFDALVPLDSRLLLFFKDCVTTANEGQSRIL